MKTFLFIAFLFLVQGNVNAQYDRELSIYFVVNDETLSDDNKSYLSNNTDLFNSSSFLFFIPYETQPYYTRKQSEVVEYINELYQRPFTAFSIINDKKVLWKQLSEFLDLGYTKINLNLFLTKSYITDKMLRFQYGYLLNFFPKELAFAFGTDDIVLNVFIGNENEVLNTSLKKDLKESFEFGNYGVFAKSFSIDFKL